MQAPDFSRGISSRIGVNAANSRHDILILTGVAAILDILLMQESLYFCMALVGHMLLLYLIYRISSSYEIILLPDRVIRKTILGTQEFPLQETVFLGIGVDESHPYRLPATHYQNRRLIRLSYNDEIICFNPNIFYNNEATHLFTPEEQQKESQVFDDAVIAFLQEKCERQAEESVKRELVIVWEIRNFFVKLFFLLLFLLPLAIAAMLAGLW